MDNKYSYHKDTNSSLTSWEIILYQIHVYDYEGMNYTMNWNS